MRISDWSSDVCSSDLVGGVESVRHHHPFDQRVVGDAQPAVADDLDRRHVPPRDAIYFVLHRAGVGVDQQDRLAHAGCPILRGGQRIISSYCRAPRPPPAWSTGCSPCSSWVFPPWACAPRGSISSDPWPCRIPWRRRTPMPASAQSRRSEEHTSELQSLMRISYAVFCL